MVIGLRSEDRQQRGIVDRHARSRKWRALGSRFGVNKLKFVRHLDDGADLFMELTVNTGKGYVASDKNKPEDAPIGLIPVDAIYSPGIQRNLDTAAPLATARGITIQRIPAENPAARIMAAGAGKTVVWVGNKGNLNSIWDALHAPGEPPLTYGDLFTVTRARIGSPLVTRARFGPAA